MINGRFYFKQTANGNLTGEYSNQTSTSNTPESAALITGNGPFIGTYNSTWFEINGSAELMTLIVGFKPGSEGRLFILSWRNNNGIQFRGEAFIADNILIGNYWNNKLEDLINQKK